MLRPIIRLAGMCLLFSSGAGACYAQSVDEINQKMLAIRGSHLIEQTPEQRLRAEELNNAKTLLREQAEQQIDDGNIRGAIATFKKMKEISLDIPYCLYGDLLAADGQMDAALVAYRSAIYKWGHDKQGNPINDWEKQIGKDFDTMSFAEREKLTTASDTSNKVRYALLLYRLGKFDEAIQVYNWARKGLVTSEGFEPCGEGWHEALDIPFSLQSLERTKFVAACYTMLGLTYQDNSFGPWYDTRSGTLCKSVAPQWDIPAKRMAAQYATQSNSLFAPAYLLLGRLYDREGKGSSEKAMKAFTQARDLARNDVVRSMAQQGLR